MRAQKNKNKREDEEANSSATGDEKQKAVAFPGLEPGTLR